LLDDPDRRQRRRAGNRITSKRRDGKPGVFVGDLRSCGRAPDRGSVGHSLCKGHDFRLDIPVFDSAPAIAGPSPSCLHLIADKDAAVTPHDLGNDFKVFLWRSDKSADSHDWFGYESGYMSGGRSLDQLFDIASALHRASLRLQVERTAITVGCVGVNNAGNHRRPVFPGSVTARSHVGYRATMVRMPKRDDLSSAGVNSGEYHCGFVGFGAAVCEIALLQIAGRYLA